MLHHRAELSSCYTKSASDVTVAHLQSYENLAQNALKLK